MKQWGSALFPLSLLMTLAALTFWLRYATEAPEERYDGKTRHDPDYVITDATVRKLDASGRLLYTLKAPEIKHYPDDETTDLTRPDLVYLQADKPPLTVTANLGHYSQDGKQVDLYGDVKLRRPPSAKDEELTASMPQLTVLPDDEKAYTRTPVFMTKGKSWARGVGMQVDNRLQTYLLESQAVAQIASRYAKKP
jgi:lipopolysaccharide export system protein LptC